MQEKSDMEFVLTEKRNRIGYITLNRADKRNALNGAFVRQLKEAFGLMERDTDVKVIILNANGPAFCAGADLDYLRQLQSNTYEENLEDSTQLMALFDQIHNLEKVVIAQIEGHAIAGGCGLATVCDFAFSVPDATFGYTEVKIGFVPAIVMVFLLRKIGETRAKELLLTGKLIEAEEAAEIGLINHVIPTEQIADKVEDFALDLIGGCSEASLSITKQMIGTVPGHSLRKALEYAAQMNARARETDDCKTGIQAFLDKKKISW